MASMPCAACNGSGRRHSGAGACPYCHGTGQIPH